MNRLTATIITYNEELNLERALRSLADLPDEILVVDSGSTDRTCEIAGRYGARLIVRPLTNLGDQKNFAAQHATHEWILSVDADEELSPQLRESLKLWRARPPSHVAYEFPRRARYLGGWIRHSGWYPDHKPRLYRRDRGRFEGVPHDSVKVEGPVGRLEGDLYHHTFHTAAQHIRKNTYYAIVAAEDLFASGRRRWLAAMLVSPPWMIFQKFILRAGFLDGYRGWLIAWITARYTFQKYRNLGVLVRGGSLPRGSWPAKTEARG